MPPVAKRPARTSRSNSLQDSQKVPLNVWPTSQKSPNSPSPLGVIEPPPIPKHFPFPNIPIESDICFEFQMFFFAVISCCLQFLQLYRSVWWLPNSHSSSTMNFYLINGYLIAFILIVLSRRLVYAGGIYLLKLAEGPSRTDKAADHEYTAFSYMLFIVFWFKLVICAVFVIDNQPRLNMLYLFYPSLLYILLFGYQVKPIFEAVGWCSKGKPPIHACSANSEYARNEAENLRNNFNDRLKQILFSSVVNAYYAGFIPCCFAQPQLQYDIYWATQHAFFIFFGSCACSVTHLLPLRYCDVLHRCALHLGEWQRVDPGRNILLVNHDWREDLVWPPNVLVKYRQNVWISTGDCNSNRPGDKGLNTFYRMFIIPAHLKSLGLSLHCILVFCQLILLIKEVHWYKIISLAMMIFFNYFTLYKFCRDFLVSYRIYREENELRVNEKIDFR